ncbi:MAG: YggT family protein [Chloroflexi bacterium]|nr:YggT family protein [Chloroflexota bacterium]
MARQYTEEAETRRTVVDPPVTAGTSVDQTEVVTHDPYAERRMGADRIVQAVYLLFGIFEGLLAIRFVLKALGANPDAGFSSFVYGITGPFLAPFAGMFGTPAASNGAVLEIHTLIAFVVYALLAWLVGKLLWLALGEDRTAAVTHSRSVDIDRRVR